MSLSELLQCRRYDIGDSFICIGANIAGEYAYDWYSLLQLIRKLHVPS